MTNALALLTVLGAALIAGVFFAFSSFVMKALTQLPGGRGVAAMQRINVVVLGPMFLGVFVGTAVLTAACVVAAFLPWHDRRSPLLLVAGLSYLVGSFGVTMAFNVPRNERLARLAEDSPEAAAYWPIYVREWLRWNHVRTAASLVSVASAAGVVAC